MFAAMVGIMTACASDEQEEMFPGEGEPVTVKLSIDTRAAGADDFESQVKTLRVYAFHNGSLVGYIIMVVRMCNPILSNGSCHKEKSGFMRWPMNKRQESCLAKTRETFLYCPVRLSGEYVRSKAWKLRRTDWSL